MLHFGHSNQGKGTPGNVRTKSRQFSRCLADMPKDRRRVRFVGIVSITPVAFRSDDAYVAEGYKAPDHVRQLLWEF